MHILLSEATRTYSNNHLYLKVLLITEF